MSCCFVNGQIKRSLRNRRVKVRLEKETDKDKNIFLNALICAQE
jgi:hypothetical protein